MRMGTDFRGCFIRFGRKSQVIKVSSDKKLFLYPEHPPTHKVSYNVKFSRFPVKCLISSPMIHILYKMQLVKYMNFSDKTVKYLFLLLTLSLPMASGAQDHREQYLIRTNRPGPDQLRPGHGHERLRDHFANPPISDHQLKASGHLTVLDSLVESRWEASTSSWVEAYKAYYTFDEEGRITEFRQRELNGDSFLWEETDYETYEYDEQGNLVLFVDFDQNEAGTEWYESYLYVYTYQDGRLSEVIESARDAPGESLYPFWRTVYQYDDADNLPEGTREYFFGLGWSETWRTERTYNENGDLVSFIDLNDSDSDWIFAWKEEFTYNEAGHLSVYERWERDEANTNWLNDDREEYNILPNGDVESFTDQDWNDGESRWETVWPLRNGPCWSGSSTTICW